MRKSIALLFALLLTLTIASACQTGQAQAEPPAAETAEAQTPAPAESVPAATPAPAEPAPAGDSLVIGHSHRSLGGVTWWEVMCATVEDYLVGKGAEVMFMDAGEDITRQNSDIDTMIAAGVDGLIIGPADETGIWPAIEKANAAGIPVVVGNDRVAPSDTIDVAAIVTNDDFAAARDAGLYEGTLLGEKYPDKATLTVAVVAGAAGQKTSENRREGFLAGLRETLPATCEIEVVGTYFTDWMTDQGYQVTTDFLAANPELDLIFSESDNMTRGVVTAVADRNLTGSIHIASYDGLKDMVKLVGDGVVDCIALNDPVATGELLAQSILDSIGGKELEPEIYPEAVTITPENFAEMYNPDSPF